MWGSSDCGGGLEQKAPDISWTQEPGGGGGEGQEWTHTQLAWGERPEASLPSPDKESSADVPVTGCTYGDPGMKSSREGVQICIRAWLRSRGPSA